MFSEPGIRPRALRNWIFNRTLHGPASRLHERSRFVKEEGAWFYVDGDLFDA